MSVRGAHEAAAAAVSVLAYTATLGWHQARWITDSGEGKGPFRAWEVAVLSLVLASFATWAGGRRHLIAAWFVPIAVTTLCFSVDAATGPESDELWPIGALGIAFFGGAALYLCALLGRALTASRSPLEGSPHP